MEQSLYETLKTYSGQDVYPFHMPGHKRRLELIKGLYTLDITEINGFDDLHQAEGILKEGMERMAQAVGAKRSWYLVGGSTCGILSAVHAAVRPGGKIYADRNCHRSVANAILLRRLNPVYIYPQCGDKWGISRGLTGDKVRKVCEQAGEKPVVILTSPTYEGHVSAVKEIAEVIHRRDGILIVDEAHGAHLPYAQGLGFPESAVSAGADLVIQSLHKTLPALTQSAALHLCSDRVAEKDIEAALRIYETSSPSYVMMAGMDACVRFMQDKGRDMLGALYGRLEDFYAKAGSWKNLEVYAKKENRDISRILIRAGKYPGSGKQLAGLFRDYGRIEPEYCTPDYVLLICTLADTEEGFLRLEEAFSAVDKKIGEGCLEKPDTFADIIPERVGREAGRSAVCGSGELQENFLHPAIIRTAPWKADEAEKEKIFTKKAIGRISGEMVYLYPPGVPFLMPGEEVEAWHVRLIEKLRSGGFELSGLEDASGETLICLKENLEK